MIFFYFFQQSLTFWGQLGLVDIRYFGGGRGVKSKNILFISLIIRINLERKLFFPILLFLNTISNINIITKYGNINFLVFIHQIDIR